MTPQQDDLWKTREKVCILSARLGQVAPSEGTGTLGRWGLAHCGCAHQEDYGILGTSPPPALLAHGVGRFALTRTSAMLLHLSTGQNNMAGCGLELLKVSATILQADILCI